MASRISWAGFEFTTSVVIGTDYIGSCKSNYHTITATTTPTASWIDLMRNECWIGNLFVKERKHWNGWNNAWFRCSHSSECIEICLHVSEKLLELHYWATRHSNWTSDVCHYWTGCCNPCEMLLLYTSVQVVHCLRIPSIITFVQYAMWLW